MGSSLSTAVQKELRGKGYDNFKVNLNALRAVALGDIFRYENGTLTYVMRISAKEEDLRGKKPNLEAKGRLTLSYKNRCEIAGDIGASASVHGAVVGGEAKYRFSKERCVMWDLYGAYLAEVEDKLNLERLAVSHLASALREASEEQRSRTYYVVSAYITGKDGVLVLRDSKSDDAVLTVKAQPISPLPALGEARLQLSHTADKAIGITMVSDKNKSITPLVELIAIGKTKAFGDLPDEELCITDDEVGWAQLLDVVAKSDPRATRL